MAGGGAPGMICERCGRLLNRATGRCVCDDYGGNAPPPVATTDLLVDEAEDAAPLPKAADPEQPSITKAEAMALLDFSDGPVRPPPPRKPAPAPVPVEPPPPPRLPGAPVGVLRGAKAGRRKVDVVVYDGRIVLAGRGAPTNMTASQLAANKPGSRLVEDSAVADAVVREDAVGGKATLKLRNGEVETLTWSGRRNRGTDAENLFTHAFSGKVDQGPPEVTKRAVKAVAGLGIGIVALVGAGVGLSALLAEDPPPPPPPPPPVTLPPAEQAARSELSQVCPAWSEFAASVPAGDRPDPVRLRPLAETMRPRFDAAAGAVGDYADARDQVGYLQEYAGRTADAATRESSSRIAFAMSTVTRACARATAAAP